MENFRNEFNKFNNTVARTLYDINITLKYHFCRKNVIILPLCCHGRHNLSRHSVNTSGLMI